MSIPFLLTDVRGPVHQASKYIWICYQTRRGRPSDMWHVACDMWQVTGLENCDPSSNGLGVTCHETHDLWNIVSTFLVPSTNTYQFFSRTIWKVYPSINPYGLFTYQTICSRGCSTNIIVINSVSDQLRPSSRVFETILSQLTQPNHEHDFVSICTKFCKYEGYIIVCLP